MSNEHNVWALWQTEIGVPDGEHGIYIVNESDDPIRVNAILTTDPDSGAVTMSRVNGQTLPITPHTTVLRYSNTGAASDDYDIIWKNLSNGKTYRRYVYRHQVVELPKDPYMSEGLDVIETVEGAKLLTYRQPALVQQATDEDNIWSDLDLNNNEWSFVEAGRYEQPYVLVPFPVHVAECRYRLIFDSVESSATPE